MLNQMFKYSQIQDQLSGKERQEQYKLLLNTYEWSDYRNRIIDLDGQKCTKCYKKEGHIIEPVPEEEYKKMLDKATKHNEKIYAQQGKPEYEEKLRKALLGDSNLSLAEVLTWPYPADTIVTGEIILQVHHKLYIISKLPWQYDRKQVTTLCSECHRYVHANSKIYTYRDETLKEKIEIIPCQRCDGTGYLLQYDYVNNGICFNCGGIGSISSIFFN